MKAAAARHFDRAAGKVAALSDETPRQKWTGIADDMIAGRKADPDATQREIGERMGQTHNWVSSVLSWRTTSFHARETPFARGDWDHRKQQIVTKTPVKQADRVKMAEKLLEDPKVVKAVLKKPSVASRGMTNAVVEKEAAAKQKRAGQEAEYQERRKESLPGIAGRAAAIITRIDQWAIELDNIRPDLHEIRGRDLELVDMAHGNLTRAAEANRDEIGRPAELRVVEGSARKPRKQLA